jgi:hypothetical protein
MCFVCDSSILRRGTVISVRLLGFIRGVAASYKSNPSPVSQGYLEVRTLGHVGDGGYTVEGYYHTRWLLGLYLTEMEGVVLHSIGVVIAVSYTIPLGNWPHPVVCWPSFRIGLRRQ